MRETELAWCAGFIDGEGTFGIQRQKGKADRRYLQAGQVDRRVLDRLSESLGGKVYGPYQPKNPNHSPYYYWRLLGSERVDKAAAMLYPYLGDVKRTQWKVNQIGD